MRALIKFNKGMLALPAPVQLWLLVLIATNLVAPLLLIDRLEAQVVVVTFLASFALMVLITGIAGLTRILGLGHILWLPMLIWLWTRLDAIPADDVFGIWVRLLMVVNALSLVLDTIDLARYIRGNRKELVDGL